MDTFPLPPDTETFYREEGRRNHAKATIQSYFAHIAEPWTDEQIASSTAHFKTLGNDTPKDWPEIAGVTYHNVTRFFDADQLWNLLYRMQREAGTRIILAPEEQLEHF